MADENESNRRLLDGEEITTQNYHLVERRIRNLQRKMPFQTPEKRKQLKPLVARLQSALQQWKNSSQINPKKRRQSESGKIQAPKPGPLKRPHIDHSSNQLHNNNNNNNINDHSTESISSRDQHSNSAISMSRINDELQLLHARLDSITNQHNDFTPSDTDLLHGVSSPSSRFPSNERLTFKRVFQRPTLSKFASTIKRNINADYVNNNTLNTDTNNAHINNNVNNNNAHNLDTHQTTQATASNEEKVAIRKKANETKLQLALKLNFKFDNKASNKVIEALKFRNNVKNWERIGSSILGWSDDVALLSVKMAFVDMSDFNDFEIKSASTMKEFYEWFDIKYNVASARQDLYRLVTSWTCPFDISLSGVIPKYLEDLDLFEGTADTCSAEMLALTPFTPIRAVNAVRDSLPKQWKDKFSAFEEIFQIFTNNLEDMHSVFVRIEERMRQENLQRANDPQFVPNMIIYKDLSKLQVNYTSNSNYNTSQARFRRGSWNSRGNNNFRGGRGGRGRGNYYSNSYDNNWSFRNNRGRRAGRRGRGRGYRGRGRNNQPQFQISQNYNNFNNNYNRLPRYINKQCFDCKLGGHLAQFHAIFALPKNTKIMFDYHQKWCKENGTNVVNFMNNPSNNTVRNINNPNNSLEFTTSHNYNQSHLTQIQNSNCNSNASNVIKNQNSANRSALMMSSSFYDDPIETQYNQQRTSVTSSNNNIMHSNSSNSNNNNNNRS